MADLARIKSNVSKMVDQGAPVADIDKYIALEGSSVDEIKAFSMPSVEPEKEPNFSMEEDVARPLLRAGRAGVAGTVGMAGDLAQMAVKPANLLSESIASGIDTLTGGNVADKMRQANQQPLPSEVLRKSIDRSTGGLTAPRNGTEENVDMASEFLAGGGAELPFMLGRAAKAAPGLIQKGMAKLTGVDQEAANAFNASGIDPSLPAISGRTAAIADKTLIDVPFAGSFIQKSAEKTLKQVKNRVENIASKYGTAETASEAGKKIQGGVGQFQERFNTQSTKLYDKLKKYVKSDELIQVDNTKKYLDEITNRFDDLPSLQNILTDPVISKAYKDIAKPGKVRNDLIMGGVKDTTLKKYNSLRNLRTAIGKKAQGLNLDGDQKAALNGLYSAISKDLEAVAASKGDEATQAFKRANSYYSAGKQRMEYLDDIAKSDVPEDVFRYAMQGTKEGGTKLVALKKSLKPDEFGALQSAFLRKMGHANPGAQDAAQDVFSANTFLTRYSNLSPEAKKALFGGKSFESKQALDNLLVVMSKIKGIDKLANHSGTGRVMGAIATTGAAFANLPATATALLGARYSAKLITNPKFARWLANGLTKGGEKALSQHIAKLSAIAAAHPEIRDDVNQYLQSLSQNQ